MNTPPPDATTPTQATTTAKTAATASGAPSISGALECDDDLAQTPPPQPLTPSFGPNMFLNGYLGEDDEEEHPLSLLLRTVDFAAFKHQCQRRKDLDRTPYVNHCIAVANILSSTGVTDIKILQAAVLHDTVEDTSTTLEEISTAFGPDVARIVGECTDDTSLNGMERKIEQLRTAPFRSREAQQVKLADKLHNLESIRRCPPVGWGVRRIQAYFQWAKQVTDVCAPANPALARRLQRLYESAYTCVNGEYIPCHPEAAGPLTEAEKGRVDARLNSCTKGQEPSPRPIFF